MADFSRNQQAGLVHKRRASDRAEERAERAAYAGDLTAMRIAGAQLTALLRHRDAFRQGSPNLRHKLARTDVA